MLKFNLLVFGLIPNNFSLISLLSFLIFATHVNAIFKNVSFITDEEMKAEELTYEMDIKNPINGLNLSNRTYYEGDILLPVGLRSKDFVNYIAKNSGLHWPNGRVPYLLESNFNDDEREQINSSFSFFERNTCIRWVAKQDNDSEWVSITHHEDGCYSGLGFMSYEGKYVLNLGSGCFSNETIIHEMMHRIGFIHEQSRPDRDLYVKIVEENIFTKWLHNFDYKPKEYFEESYYLPYDIHSVMHYEEYSFSKNGHETIMAISGKRLGCRQFGMKCPTDLDIEKINTVYNCQEKLKKQVSFILQSNANVTKACGTIACLEERFNFLIENYVKAYDLKIKDLEKQFSDKVENTIEDIRKNPFPIGFIYVQLPKEKSPTEIWPWMIWKDITTTYAGVFFRAEGGGSAAFGATQNENSPRLIEARYGHHKTCDKNYHNVRIYTNGLWSDWVTSSTENVGWTVLTCMSLKVSSGEVRPRNMAIRVWKRTG